MAVNPDSYTNYGSERDQVVGEVVEIGGGDNYGLVKIRIEGHQSFAGGIPDDKLSWVQAALNGAQNAGVGVTHRYLPGSIVQLKKNVDGTYFILGAVAGAGEKKNKGSKGRTDYPANAGPEKAGKTVKPRDQEIAEKRMIQPKPGEVDYRKDKPQDYVKYDDKTYDEYAKEKANGKPAAHADEPTVATKDFDGGASATQFIKGIDPGNIGGAVQQALNLSQDFFSSGPNILTKMLSMSALGGALSQMQDVFGPLGILGEAQRKFSALTGVLNNMTNALQGISIDNIADIIPLIENVPQMLTDPIYDIEEAVKADFQNAINSVSEKYMANDLLGAVNEIQNVIPHLNNVFNNIGGMAAELSNIQIPKLPAADLLKDFAGQLTPIKIPELTLDLGFTKIPTFDEEMKMVQSEMKKTLTAELNKLKGLV